MAQRVGCRACSRQCMGAPQFDEDGVAQGGQRLWENRALGCWVVSGARPCGVGVEPCGWPAGLPRAGPSCCRRTVPTREVSTRAAVPLQGVVVAGQSALGSTWPRPLGYLVSPTFLASQWERGGPAGGGRLCGGVGRLRPPVTALAGFLVVRPQRLVGATVGPVGGGMLSSVLGAETLVHAAWSAQELAECELLAEGSLAWPRAGSGF